jgi:hypothetical protein
LKVGKIEKLIEESDQTVSEENKEAIVFSEAFKSTEVEKTSGF